MKNAEMQGPPAGGAPLNWDDLKVVLAIGRAGSLTKAALLLGMDQSTAGRRLGAAEAALGAVLFIRSKTGFAPTEAGEEAIARALEIESRALRLTEALANPEQGVTGPVRLFGHAWVLCRLADVAMPALLARHPRLQVHAVAGPRPSGLMGGDAAVGLWFDSTPRETEFAVKLGDVPYAVYARRTGDGPSADWVCFPDDDGAEGLPARWRGRLGAEGRALRLTATDAGVLLASVRAGVGRGLLPMCLAEGDPALVRVGQGAPDLLRTLYIHVHPDTVQTARVQAAMAWLRETFEPAFDPPVPACPHDTVPMGTLPGG